MPRRDDVKKVLIIGSGPIVIGQACEFDYSGTQACKALRKLGYEIVLVNSNPATIMTDPGMADRTYIEALNIETLTEAVGFHYERLPSGDQLDFNHPATLIILSPERQITGYIRGQTFVPADVTLALIEAKAGRIRRTRSNVGKRGLLSFCYTYDPVQQKRTLSITRVAAFAILALIGVFVVLVLIFKVGAAPAPNAEPEPEEE